MANWNRWAVAAGLAGALAVFGPAWAQNGSSAGAAGSGTSTGDTASKQGSDQTSGTGMSQGSSTSDSGSTGERAAGSTMGSSDRTAAGSSATGAAASGKVDKKLEEDLQKIHAANQAEVHMGQMGQQQATSSEVKDFAQKLEQDHQKLDDQLTQTAQAAGISLEGKGAESQQKAADKEMKKLQGKTGPAFDKAFLSMMVKDHEKDIKETKKAASQAKKDKQTELASLLDQAVTGMQGHLATAKQLEKTVAQGKSAGSMGGSSSTGMGSSGSSSTGSSAGSSGMGTPGSSETGAGSGSSSGSSGSSTSAQPSDSSTSPNPSGSGH